MLQHALPLVRVIDLQLQRLIQPLNDIRIHIIRHQHQLLLRNFEIQRKIPRYKVLHLLLLFCLHLLLLPLKLAQLNRNLSVLKNALNIFFVALVLHLYGLNFCLFH